MDTEDFSENYVDLIITRTSGPTITISSSSHYDFDDEDFIYNAIMEELEEELEDEIKGEE